MGTSNSLYRDILGIVNALHRACWHKVITRGFGSRQAACQSQRSAVISFIVMAICICTDCAFRCAIFVVIYLFFGQASTLSNSLVASTSSSSAKSLRNKPTFV